jgi:cardiolipin synthase
VARLRTVRQRKPARVPSRAVEAVRVFFHGRPWWEKTILIIGLVTIVTFVAFSFLGVNAKPRTIVISGELGPVESPVFRTTVARLVGTSVEQGGDVTIYNNGDEFLPALLEAIRSARATVNFSVFMWQDGTFSVRVLEALLERQRHGVEVRVLLDALAAMGASDKRFDELKEAGGQLAVFRQVGLGTWMRLHRRNHRRAIVIDGKVGFTGGMAVNDKWLGHAQDPKHWRDMMFKVTGAMASSLQAAFADAWVSSSGEIIAGPGMYPMMPPAAGPPFIHLVQSPADDKQSMAYFFLAPVRAARHRIVLVTPYFLPDAPMRHALAQQARAGVDVRLLLPGPHTDNFWVRFSGQTRYDELLDAGVKIFEYQPTFVHAKYFVVDGQWSIFGSPNLDFRSRDLDEENAFAVLDPVLGQQLEAIFARDVQQAVPINLQEWRQRNPLLRLFQYLSRVLDNQS